MINFFLAVIIAYKKLPLRSTAQAHSFLVPPWVISTRLHFANFSTLNTICEAVEEA